MAKRVFSMVCIVGFFFFIATLSTFGPADAGPKKSEYLYFVGSTPHFTPVVIAAQNGYFKENGLNVKVKTFTSGGMAAQSFAAGQGDFVCSGDFPAARMWAASKGGIIGIHQAITMRDLSVIVTTSDIKKGAQLKGKRIGYFAGTNSEFFAAKFLAVYGLKFKDVILKNLRPPEMVVALDRGDIDAFIVWQPFGWRALKVSGSKVHILETGAKYFANHMVISTRKDIVENDADAAIAEIKGMVKAVDYVNNNLDGAVKIVGDFFKIPYPDVKKFLVSMELGLAYDKALRNDMDEVNNFMMTKGKSKAPIDWKNQFAPQFLKAVNPKYVE
jgi:ABC-type nitrate/sulfonate/bicarbonate transport system substrate-binding protein